MNKLHLLSSHEIAYGWKEIWIFPCLPNWKSNIQVDAEFGEIGKCIGVSSEMMRVGISEGLLIRWD